MLVQKKFCIDSKDRHRTCKPRLTTEAVNTCSLATTNEMVRCRSKAGNVSGLSSKWVRNEQQVSI